MAPIHFGCLLFQYQAIDVLGPTDLLNSCSKRLNTALKYFGIVDEDTLSRSPDFVFHHIGLTRDPVELLTSSVTIVPTTTVDDCPEIDCLVLGGPAPVGHEVPPKYVEFIRRHVASGKTLFTTCTGAVVAAQAGVLNSKNATINNVEYNWVKSQYPNVNWTNQKKWIVDGNIWTAAGAVAGMDMFAYWIQREFGLDVLVQGALGLDYEPRDNDGLFNVLPKRFDGTGKQISTHGFRNHEFR